MKTIEIDDELYHYIASRTQAIGENASDILRRLLRLPASPQPFVLVQETLLNEQANSAKTTRNQKIALNHEKATKRIESVLKSADFVSEKKVVNRFLKLLSVLYLLDPEGFALAAETVQGSERIYFSRDKEDILTNGSSAKARQIPASPFWVITNNNTERKGIILSALMGTMQLPDVLIERVKNALL